MAGLYIHIPFCRKACHYCNFHFSTSLRLREAVVEALCRELEVQRHFLGGRPLETLYLGGGTPSLLPRADLMRIFDAVMRHYTLSADAEVTLEANPDDLTPERLAAFRQMPINRLSIGVQSFRDEDLRFMNRTHDAATGRRAVLRAQDAGFENITIDLIYGTPGLDAEAWAQNVEQALALEVPHISAYCLTVEPRTALAHFVRQGRVSPPDEGQAAGQLLYLIERLEAAGFVHYEISNFGREGYWSRHNASYWLGKPYLGVGPSAHSYDGRARYWNVAHNVRYVKALASGVLPQQRELLRAADRYNEYVMMRLRTVWGVRLDELEALGPHWRKWFLREVAGLLRAGWVWEEDGVWRLTRQGKLFADRVAAELFFTE